MDRKMTYQGAPLRQFPQRRAMKILLALLVLLLLWVLFMPGRGLLSLLRLRREMVSTQQENALLRQENARLQQEVEHLRDDDAALEQVARSKFGLVKPNEIVYKFSRNPKAGAKHGALLPQDEEQSHAPAAAPEVQARE